MIDWVFTIQWVNLDTPDDARVWGLPEESAAFVKRWCATRRLKVPFGSALSASGTPDAFSFGHVLAEARVDVASGHGDVLSPSTTLNAVIAHEIGHIEHWDFAVMMVASLVPMLLYQMYVFLGLVATAARSRTGPTICGLVGSVHRAGAQSHAWVLRRSLRGSTCRRRPVPVVRAGEDCVRAGSLRRRICARDDSTQGADKKRARREHGAQRRSGHDAPGAASIGADHPRIRPGDGVPVEVILWDAPVVQATYGDGLTATKSLHHLGIVIPTDLGGGPPVHRRHLDAAHAYRYHGMPEPQTIGTLLEDLDVSEMRPRAVRIQGTIPASGVPGAFWSPVSRRQGWQRQGLRENDQSILGFALMALVLVSRPSRDRPVAA